MHIVYALIWRVQLWASIPLSEPQFPHLRNRNTISFLMGLCEGFHELSHRARSSSLQMEASTVMVTAGKRKKRKRTTLEEVMAQEAGLSSVSRGPGRGRGRLAAPFPANNALCHQRHLALRPGCVLGVITCPFKFWELSLTGAEVYLHRLFQLPCSPCPSLRRGTGEERHLLSMFNFHEERASWEGGPLKCSGLAGNESQEAAPIPDTGLPLSGDGEEEGPFLKGESNWLEIRVEEKNDDESDLGVKTEWASGSSQPGLRSPAGHILVESWGTFAKCMCVCALGCNQLCDPWTVARQVPLSKEFSRICKNTGAGCHFLLQGIFLTQGSNPCLLHLLHWQVDSLPAEPPERES